MSQLSELPESTRNSIRMVIQERRRAFPHEKPEMLKEHVWRLFNMGIHQGLRDRQGLDRIVDQILRVPRL